MTALFSARLLQDPVYCRRIGLAFHGLHGLAYQKTDGFLLPVPVILHRLRIGGDHFRDRLLQSPFIVDGL